MKKLRMITILLLLIAMTCNAQQGLYPKEYVFVSDSIIKLGVSHESDFIGIELLRLNRMMTLPNMGDWVFYSGTDTLFHATSANMSAKAIAMLITRNDRLTSMQYLENNYLPDGESRWLFEPILGDARAFEYLDSSKTRIKRIVCCFRHSETQYIIMDVSIENEMLQKSGKYFWEVYFNMIPDQNEIID